MVNADEFPFKLSLSNQYSKLTAVAQYDPHIFKASLLSYGTELYPYLYYGLSTKIFESSFGFLLDFNTQDYLFQHALLTNSIALKSTLFETSATAVFTPNQLYGRLNFGPYVSVSGLTESINSNSVLYNRQTLAISGHLDSSLFSLFGSIHLAKLLQPQIADSSATQNATGSGLYLGISIPYTFFLKNEFKVVQVKWNWDQQNIPNATHDDLYLTSFFENLSHLRDQSSVDSIYLVHSSTYEKDNLTCKIEWHTLQNLHLLQFSTAYSIDKHLSLKGLIQKTDNDFKIIAQLSLTDFLRI